MLDAALYPDFGQVEVDPAVVNLTAFETFFPERRPFFSRDDRMFQFGLAGGQNQLIHSRRIGRRPSGRAPAGADFVSMPSETTVIAATKVTGRTAWGLSVGLLGAVTDHEHGWAYFEDEEEAVRFDAEPRTHYGVVSLSQDLRQGQTRIGGILSMVDRSLPANGSLDFLPSEAYSGLLNFDHSWADRRWRLSGHYASSRVQGSEEAMLRIQLSPIHYHQRPDQGYLTLDPDATQLTGADWELALNRSTRHWNSRVMVGRRTPGFEVNDLGFYTGSERIFFGTRAQYSQPSPRGNRFQNYSVSVGTFHGWRNSVRSDFFSRESWSDAYRGGRLQASANLTFYNWWGLRLNTQFSPTAQSDTLTRGGPLMTDPGSREFNVSVNTDERAALTWNGWAGYSEDTRRGRWSNVGFGFDARPTNGLHLSASLSYSRGRDVRQYVAQVADPSFEATFGRRYFFADADREQLSLNLRANMIFSPNLSLELFAQPLVAAGDFVTYKQLARPRSFDFLHFSEGEPVGVDSQPGCTGGNLCRNGQRIHLDYTGDGIADTSFREQNFNLRSLGGNAVLRWEYMPGSRLYVVWQHLRDDRLALGNFDLSRDGRALLSGSGENVFMIKVDRLFYF